MPVLGWHIIAGNHDIIDLLILYGADVNQQFDGVDEEGEMVGIFQVCQSDFLLLLIYVHLYSNSLIFILQSFQL